MHKSVTERPACSLFLVGAEVFLCIVNELAQFLMWIITRAPSPSSASLSTANCRRICRFVIFRLAFRISCTVCIGFTVCICFDIIGFGARISYCGRIGRLILTDAVSIYCYIFHVDVLVSFRLDGVVNHNLVSSSWRHGYNAPGSVFAVVFL